MGEAKRRKQLDPYGQLALEKEVDDLKHLPDTGRNDTTLLMDFILPHLREASQEKDYPCSSQVAKRIVNGHWLLNQLPDNAAHVSLDCFSGLAQDYAYPRYRLSRELIGTARDHAPRPMFKDGQTKRAGLFYLPSNTVKINSHPVTAIGYVFLNKGESPIAIFAWAAGFDFNFVGCQDWEYTLAWVAITKTNFYSRRSPLVFDEDKDTFVGLREGEYKTDGHFGGEALLDSELQEMDAAQDILWTAIDQAKTGELMSIDKGAASRLIRRSLLMPLD